MPRFLQFVIVYTLAGLATHLILMGREADLWSIVVVVAWPVFAGIAILAVIGGFILLIFAVLVLAFLFSS